MSKLGRLLNLLKNLSGNQRKPLEAITTISKGIDKGVMIEKPVKIEVPMPESVPAAGFDGVPPGLRGMSYGEIKLLAEDGGLSQEEEIWFGQLQGPSDKRGRREINLKYYLKKGLKNG